MPICYDIEIDMVYEDDDTPMYDTKLRRRIVSNDPLTPEQIRDQINQFWQDFEQLMHDTFPSRRQGYRRGEGQRVTSVYRC